jgi:ubiquinone/menaquinone biosynthesis C-methylase UbiE
VVPKSIAAYEDAQRVASYDASMEIMHPNRAKMVQVALDILPFSAEKPLHALDLGMGTGYFTGRFLRRYPNARLCALDGSTAMLGVARARLGPLAERVRFFVGDFRELARLLPEGESFDVAFSSFALHHLSRDDKQAVIRQVRDRLRAGGWFLNADILVAETPEIERRIQELRVRGIIERAPADARFANAQATRDFLDRMEAEDGDQPLTLLEDLQVLRGAGLRGVTPFWVEYREAVCGGMKPLAAPPPPSPLMGEGGRGGSRSSE